MCVCVCVCKPRERCSVSCFRAVLLQDAFPPCLKQRPEGLRREMQLLHHLEEGKPLSKPCCQKRQSWHSSCLRHPLLLLFLLLLQGYQCRSKSEPESGGDLCWRLSRWSTLCQVFCVFTHISTILPLGLLAAALVIWVVLTKKRKKHPETLGCENYIYKCHIISSEKVIHWIIHLAPGQQLCLN